MVLYSSAFMNMLCGLTRRRQWNLIRRDQMTRTNRTSGRYVSLECWSKFHQIGSYLIYSKSLFSVLKIFLKCIVHEIHIEIQGTFLCFHDALVSWKAKTIKIKWNLERKHLRKLYHWGHMQCCYCALANTKPHQCGSDVLLIGDTFWQWIIKPSPMHHSISCLGQGTHFPPEPQRWHIYCFPRCCPRGHYKLWGCLGWAMPDQQYYKPWWSIEAMSRSATRCQFLRPSAPLTKDCLMIHWQLQSSRVQECLFVY
jgi:hypothetical protein